MDTKLERTLAIIAAIFVLFTALLSPWVSAILAAALLAGFGVAKIIIKGKNSPKGE